MSEVEIKATVAKLNVDEKKATIQLEVAVSSWGEIPKLTNLVGEFVDVSIAVAED